MHRDRKGEKFLPVVSTSEAPAVRPLSSEIKSPARDIGQPELFPGRAIINFPDTELSQLVKHYADLTGRELDSTQHLPQSIGTVKFTTQTALNNEECAYALETLLSWRGFKVISVGTDCFKVILVSDARR